MEKDRPLSGAGEELLREALIELLQGIILETKEVQCDPRTDYLARDLRARWAYVQLAGGLDELAQFCPVCRVWGVRDPLFKKKWAISCPSCQQLLAE